MGTLTDLAARIIINAEDRTGAAFRSVNAGTQSVVSGIEKLETAAKRILGITLFAGMAKEAIELSDSYKTLQSRLKLVSDDTAEFTKAQTELFNIAQRTRSGLSDTYSIYSKLETAIKLLGGTQTQAIQTTETLNQAIKLTSQGAAQDSAAIMQFSQALGSGVLRGDEFNSVMENSPGLANALAIGLDVPVSKLREMSQAGKLTADVLINALGKSAPQIAAQFAILPVTVSGAMTQVKNALLTFIGQSESANAATSKLSNLIQGVAIYFNQLASGAIILAEVYATRLVVGMIASTKAFFDNAAAARVAAAAAEQQRIAALALLQTRVQEAEAAVLVKRNLLLEAAQRRALATTIAAETAAITNLARARNALEASQASLIAANARLARSQETVAVSTGLLSRALGVLGMAINRLFLVWIAVDIAKMALEWAEQFKWVNNVVQLVTANINQMSAKFIAFGSFIARPLTFDSIKEFNSELNSIGVRYDEIRAAIGKVDTADAESAEKIALTEEEKTQAVEVAALKQQQAFATTQAAVKALTATIDADTKAQSAIIQQGLTDRLAAIEIEEQTKTQKDTLKTQAKLAAAAQELQLNQQANVLKLQLIEQEYAAELLSAQNNAERLKAVESSKREAKLSVYKGVAEFYSGEIARLSTLYGEENAAFAQSRNDLQTLAKNHEQALLDIDRLGMTEYEKIRSDQDAFDQKLELIRKERKKGEKGDQVKINELIEDAKKLNVNLTEAVKTGGVEQYKAKENINRLYAVEKLALTDNSKAHEANADAIKKALDTAKSELIAANAQIKTLTDALTKEYLLKVGLDQASVSAAQAQINELTKPETKIITIITQNAGGGSGDGGGQSKGGPVGFAIGGYANRSGFLPGFGGGDKIRALLEAGEFIVRKEAVQALGVPVLHNWINQGQLPVNGVIKRAMGGAIGYNMDDELQKKKDERIKQAMEVITANQLNFGLTAIGTWSGSKAASNSEKVLRQVAGQDYDKYKDRLFEIINTPMGSDKWNILREHIMDKSADSSAATPKFTIPKLPEAITKFNEASAQKASSSLVQSAQKTVNVQFSAPGADPVAGQFNEADVDKLLKSLKAAGLRTSL